MKIIIDPDLLNTLVGLNENDEPPSVNEILNNDYIKEIINNDKFKVIGVYVDTVDATNLNNYVIEIAPLI